MTFLNSPVWKGNGETHAGLGGPHRYGGGLPRVYFRCCSCCFVLVRLCANDSEPSAERERLGVCFMCLYSMLCVGLVQVFLLWTCRWLFCALLCVVRLPWVVAIAMFSLTGLLYGLCSCIGWRFASCTGRFFCLFLLFGVWVSMCNCWGVFGVKVIRMVSLWGGEIHRIQQGGAPMIGIMLTIIVTIVSIITLSIPNIQNPIPARIPCIIPTIIWP